MPQTVTLHELEIFDHSRRQSKFNNFFHYTIIAIQMSVMIHAIHVRQELGQFFLFSFLDSNELKFAYMMYSSKVVKIDTRVKGL